MINVTIPYEAFLRNLFIYGFLTGLIIGFVIGCGLSFWFLKRYQIDRLKHEAEQKEKDRINSIEKTLEPDKHHGCLITKDKPHNRYCPKCWLNHKFLSIVIYDNYRGQYHCKTCDSWY